MASLTYTFYLFQCLLPLFIYPVFHFLVLFFLQFPLARDFLEGCFWMVYAVVGLLEILTYLKMSISCCHIRVDWIKDNGVTFFSGKSFANVTVFLVFGVTDEIFLISGPISFPLSRWTVIIITAIFCLEAWRILSLFLGLRNFAGMYLSTCTFFPVVCPSCRLFH